MRLPGVDDARRSDGQDLLIGRIKNTVQQASLNYVDARPDTGLGAMLAAQTCWQGVLIENGRLFVGRQPSRKWIVHDDTSGEPRMKR